MVRILQRHCRGTSHVRSQGKRLDYAELQTRIVTHFDKHFQTENEREHIIGYRQKALFLQTCPQIIKLNRR